MSAFERDNTAGRDGSLRWRMEISDGDGTCSNLYARGRRLIFEPRASPHPERGATVDVWVETRRPRYHWISDEPRRRPRAADMPHVVIDTIEVPNSRRYEFSKHPMEYVVIQALAKYELVGESASTAVYSLFWQHFVEDDDGLHYLYRFASKETGNYYGRLRMQRYIDRDQRNNDLNARRAVEEARHAVEEAMKDHDETLGERFCRRVAVDANLRDAIEALCRTGEPEDVRQRHIRQLVLTNATRMDHVIARINDACNASQGLLGLRACQRAERDATFFAAVDAYVLAHPDGKGLVKFLKPHCPMPKPTKSSPYGDDVHDDVIDNYEEVDDDAA